VLSGNSRRKLTSNHLAHNLADNSSVNNQTNHLPTDRIANTCTDRAADHFTPNHTNYPLANIFASVLVFDSLTNSVSNSIADNSVALTISNPRSDVVADARTTSIGL
jgi:hypothetical protein